VRYHPGYRYSPLESLADYPVMTVNIVPAQPADFVLTINKTRYQAGEWKFRVVPGATSIIVTRLGREPCERSLEVTRSGPNAIGCQM